MLVFYLNPFKEKLGYVPCRVNLILECPLFVSSLLKVLGQMDSVFEKLMRDVFGLGFSEVTRDNLVIATLLIPK